MKDRQLSPRSLPAAAGVNDPGYNGAFQERDLELQNGAARESAPVT